MSSRRNRLANLSLQEASTTNAGLWLDKFIHNQAEDDKKSRRSLVDDVAGVKESDEYSIWFKRWEGTLLNYGAQCRVAEVLGRMAVGLGEESVLETSVALHHTYGVPYIPGSAIKGMAASFARQYLGDKWQVGASAYKTVFGDTENAGYFIFFDALPLPGTGHLYPDVITVHHKDYYQKGNLPPADWDNPSPVPFLSATGKYLIAVAGPAAWTSRVFEILQYAFLELGVGAKTSSGYGRLKLKPASIVADKDQERADQLVGQIKALKNSDVAGRIQAFYEQWKNIEINAEQKRRIAEAIIARVKEASREKQSREKSWYKDLLASLVD
ncbi:MAG TPA: type III-B CRISPR module RAMP protein Cmr6 [Bacillota bacterium]|nr:type III-B CRISPR module RAMP protein Cmr6 [Bacillota bacterium]